MTAPPSGGVTTYGSFRAGVARSVLAAVDLAIGRDEVLGDFHPLLEPEIVIRESRGPAPAT